MRDNHGQAYSPDGSRGYSLECKDNSEDAEEKLRKGQSGGKRVGKGREVVSHCQGQDTAILYAEMWVHYSLAKRLLEEVAFTELLADAAGIGDHLSVVVVADGADGVVEMFQAVDDDAYMLLLNPVDQ